MKLTYLLINFFTVIVPLIFSFHPKIRFDKKWRHFFGGNLIVAILFIGWDIYFTASGVWSFNGKYITGINLKGLPIEEMLFFICIPFACVFTYYCLTKFYTLNWNVKKESVFCIIFSATLLVIGIINLHKLYTSVTFISTAIACLLLKFIIKINWIGKAFSVYAVLLIPFLIVNGLLTGTGLEEPVVLYNKAENLGIRIATIPVEDVFYGFELILLNLFFYNYREKRNSITSTSVTRNTDLSSRAEDSQAITHISSVII
jgi:lycopene cyclase domain-containing protein